MDLPLGLYIHLPWCERKCPYCDFNSHVREAVDQSRWRTALLRELTEMAQRVPERRVESVFFGGGTPSLMAPETFAAVIGAASFFVVNSESAGISESTAGLLLSLVSR